MQLVLKSIINQLSGGDVDTQRQVSVFGVLSAKRGYVAACLLQDEQSQGLDLAGAFREPDELTRVHLAMDWVVPTRQCLDTARMTIGEGEVRLVVHGDLAAAQRMLQPLFELEPTQASTPHAGLEDRDPTIFASCRGHRRAGVRQQLLHFEGDKGRTMSDTDADPHRELHSRA